MKRHIIISSCIILSFVSFMICTDFFNYYFEYNKLLELNNIISYQISKKGVVDKTFKEYYYTNYQVTINTDKTIYVVGEICEYEVVKKIDNFCNLFVPEYIKIESKSIIGIFNY